MQSATPWRVATSTIVKYWRISLGLGLVVIGAVALLLSILTRTVDRIEAGAAEIWRVGKLIANNTVHIPLLARTNKIAADLVETAGGIEQAVARIHRAAAGESASVENRS